MPARNISRECPGCGARRSDGARSASFEAATRQMQRLAFYHSFNQKAHELAGALAERLIALMPGPMSKVFFNNSGSEANDTAVKLVWYYNNALRPASQEEDHRAHARLSRRHRGFREPDRPCRQSSRFRPADRQRCATPIARITTATAAAGRERGGIRRPARRRASTTQIQREDPDTVAAFIAEPVMGAGGVIVPPASYFAKIQAVLQQARRAAHRRRGDLRLRPHRAHVRLRDLRHRARHHDGGEGAVLGLSADLGDDRLRGDLSRARRGEREDRHLRARLHLFRPSGVLRRGARDAGDLRGTATSSTMSRAVAPVLQAGPAPLRRPSPGRRGARHRPHRRASSWCATRRPRRRSRRRPGRRRAGPGANARSTGSSSAPWATPSRSARRSSSPPPRSRRCCAASARASPRRPQSLARQDAASRA